MSSKVLIPWSGGFDSTALLLRSLWDRHSISTVYFRLPNNAEKAVREEEARAKMKKLIEDSHDFEFTDIVINLPMVDSRSKRFEMSQPPLWAMGIGLAMMSSHIHFDKIALAYVRGDCAWAIHQGYQKAIDGLHELAWAEMDGGLDSVKPPEVVFPLRGVSKERIHNTYTPKSLRSILKNTWTCEHPAKFKKGFRQCGKCIPCTKRLKIK